MNHSANPAAFPVLKWTVALGLLALISWTSLRKQTVISISSEVPTMSAEDLTRAKQRLEKLSASYQDAQQRDMKAAEFELKRIIESARSQCDSQAAAAARPFQGFGNVSHCVAMGAQDTFDHGSRLNDYAAESLKPATRLLSGTQQKLTSILEALRQRSLARANDYSKETLELAGQYGLSPVDLGLDRNGTKSISSGVDDALARPTTAALAVGLEAALIRTTWTSLSNVLKPLIKKAAQVAAGAGVAVVCDGPLPVGDIVGALIAVGGGIWTAWDVKQAVNANRDLPSKIESGLLQQITGLENASFQLLQSFNKDFGDHPQPGL